MHEEASDHVKGRTFNGFANFGDIKGESTHP